MNGLLALALAAGMLAPVNPCGFALLPAWIAYTLGDTDTSPLPVRLARAVRAGTALTIGFAGTLAAAGLIISAGARTLITAAPWLGLATGIVLLVLGILMLTGRPLHLRITAPRSVTGTGASIRTWRLAGFGVGYAASSLSCTVGVLLAVIAQAQATASYAGLLTVFAAYATGSATVLLLVSISTAAASAALTRRLSRLARHGNQVTAMIVILTGGYLGWYWYPAAAHGTSSGNSNVLARFSATASTWISSHTTLLTVLTSTIILTVTAVAVARRLRTTRRPTPSPTHATNQTDCCTTDNRTIDPTASRGI